MLALSQTLETIKLTTGPVLDRLITGATVQRVLVALSCLDRTVADIHVHIREKISRISGWELEERRPGGALAGKPNKCFVCCT